MKDSSLSYMGGSGYNRNNSKSVEVNQHTGHLNDGRTVNFGRGPTVGNKGTKSTPGTSSLPNIPKGKEMFTNTTQVRTPGGTRAWDPKCEQNYKGNADRINMGRGPTKD